MKTFNPLTTLPAFDINNPFLQLDVLEVFHLLKALSPRKAPGSDNISNWLFKEYAEFLAQPVCKILKSSYVEQQLPKSWKLANIVPLLKTKPVNDISKELR